MGVIDHTILNPWVPAIPAGTATQLVSFVARKQHSGIRLTG